jgi:hypothetical protein
MKKYLSLLIIAFSMLNSSCNDKYFLDIPQQGVLSVKDSYQKVNDDGVNALIAAVYFKVRGSSFAESYGGEQTSSVYGLRYTFNQRDGEFADYYDYLGTSQTLNYRNIWTYYYTVIYWCNMIIDNVPANNVASAGVKTQVIGEARTIRAIMMMHLVQLYGNPPLADHILTGLEGNTPAADSWSFIEKELAAAAEMLPSKTNKNTQNLIGGRLTKEAAYAYLGKALLWEKKYTEAATVLHDKVIKTGLYELVSDFSVLNSKSSNFCSENLWEYAITNTSGYELSQNGMFDVVQYNWGSTGVYFPTAIYSVAGWNRNNGFSESFGTFMQQHEITTNSQKSKRYRATILSYEELIDPTIMTYSSENKGVKGTGMSSNEGYFRLKFIPRNEDIVGTAGSYQYNFSLRDESFMRYAEVLLNYAEAVAMGGTSGSTLTGLQALNLVRNRAGLSDAPALDMNNTDYGIKAERRAELVFEGHRFIDLVRWGDAPTVLADCGKYTPTFYGYKDKNNTTIQVKANWNIMKVTTLGNGFQKGRDELFPIPNVEINDNPNLVQNPNW